MKQTFLTSLPLKKAQARSSIVAERCLTSKETFGLPPLLLTLPTPWWANLSFFSSLSAHGMKKRPPPHTNLFTANDLAFVANFLLSCRFQEDCGAKCSYPAHGSLCTAQKQFLGVKVAKDAFERQMRRLSFNKGAYQPRGSARVIGQIATMTMLTGQNKAVKAESHPAVCVQRILSYAKIEPMLPMCTVHTLHFTLWCVLSHAKESKPGRFFWPIRHILCYCLGD